VRLSELEQAADRAQIEMAQELERLRRSFRAEIVPYAAGSTALVRSVDATSPFDRRKYHPT